MRATAVNNKEREREVPEGLVVPGVEQGIVAGARHRDHVADEERCNWTYAYGGLHTKVQTRLRDPVSWLTPGRPGASSRDLAFFTLQHKRRLKCERKAKALPVGVPQAWLIS